MNGSSPTGATPTPASADPPGAADRGGVGVAVSGGPDSLALLFITWRAARSLGLRVVALHVNHGLQPVADTWPLHLHGELERWAARFGGPSPQLRVTRLSGSPTPGLSVEDWARRGRRQALTSMAREQGIDLVLLAQHRQDQAETLLLQALRGAGPEGLAGMPAQDTRDGITWSRPWLARSRHEIAAVVDEWALRPVHDPSNDDPRWARNRLRQQVWPALLAAFPQAEATLAASARQTGRSLATLRLGAQTDHAACIVDCDTAPMPDAQSASNAAMPLRVRLRGLEWDALDSGRRAQVLRLQLRRWGIHSPPAQVVESVCARAHDASPRTWPLPGGWQLAWYRSELSLRRDEPMLSALPEAATVVFTEPGRQPVAAWGGVLSLRPAKLGEWGVSGHLPLVLTLRARQATDRFQAAPASLARSLKKQFQAAGIPQWARHAPVVCEPQGRIVLVPGLGLDARVCSGGGGWMLEWTPMPPARAGGEPTLE